MPKSGTGLHKRKPNVPSSPWSKTSDHHPEKISGTEHRMHPSQRTSLYALGPSLEHTMAEPIKPEVT